MVKDEEYWRIQRLHSICLDRECRLNSSECPWYPAKKKDEKK